MKNPPHTQVSEHEPVMHRLLTPTVRLFSAAIILVMGFGIASVFWKIPTNAEANHALFHGDMIDENIMATPLPCESLALLSHHERMQIELPTLDIAPAVGDGRDKIAQLYEPPAALIARVSEPHVSEPHVSEPHVSEPEGMVFPVAVEPMLLDDLLPSQPMRHIVERPIMLELVDRDFPSKPESVCTTERSDILLTTFHFAENSRASLSDSTELTLPSDPFSAAMPSATVPSAAVPSMASPSATVPPMPTLQPLVPIEFGNLAPLLPL